MKRLSRFHMEPYALLGKIIKVKYQRSFVDSIPIKGKFSTNWGLWRSITKSLAWFENKQAWEINNGEKISFWPFDWSQEGPLSIKYARLFALSLSKDQTIKKAWNSTVNSWNINTRRNMNDSESSLWNQIKNNLPVPREDKGISKPTWKLESNMIFTIAFLKNDLQILPRQRVILHILSLLPTFGNQA